MENKHFILSILLGCITSFSALGQTTTIKDTVKIKEVSILSEEKSQQLQVVENEEILKRKELLSNDGIHLAPVLNRIPGVYMQQGALNTGRIVVRGVGSRTQFSSNRIKAYINNIPISSADGETVLEDLDPNLFENLKVYKSPQAIYGANLGGLFLFNTATTFPNSFSHTQTLGSFGLLSNSTTLSLNGAKGSLALSYNRVEKDGYRENSDYRKDAFTLLSKQKAFSSSLISYFIQYTDLKAFIPSSISKNNFENTPESAAFTWKEAKGYESYKKWIGGFNLETDWSSHLKTSVTLFTRIRNGYEPRPFNILEEKYGSFGARFQLNWKHSLFAKKSNFIIGTELLRESNDISIYENLYQDFPNQGSVEGDRQNRNLQNINSSAYFFKESISWSEKLQTSVALNIATASYRAADSTFGIRQEKSIEPSISPELAINYSLTTTTRLYGIWSYGIANPNFENALNSNGIFNSNLRTERGRNLELGTQLNLFNDQFSIQGSVYQLELSNMIVSQPISEDEFISVNTGEVNNRGVEISLQADFPLSDEVKNTIVLNSSFNFYTFGEFNENNVDYSGNQLTGSPDKTINLFYELYFLRGFILAVNYFYVGQIPLNDANTSFSSDYHLFHLNLTYQKQLTKRLNVKVRTGINNVLDRNYAASILPNARAFGNNPPRYYYPGDARNFFTSVRLVYSLESQKKKS